MKETQYQECSLQEATHAQTSTGKMYETSRYEKRLWLDVEGSTIHPQAWKVLGIKPLKEVKREPIVFEETFARLQNGDWQPMYNLDDGFAYQNNKKTRFRCVEILEDEE